MLSIGGIGHQVVANSTTRLRSLTLDRLGSRGDPRPQVIRHAGIPAEYRQCAGSRCSAWQRATDRTVQNCILKWRLLECGSLGVDCHC
jgi:hypothetical protein